MASGKKFRERFEQPVAWIGLAIIPRLSRRTVLALAGWAGRLGYRLLGHHRAVAEANLAIAYGDGLAREDRQRIVRQSFRTMALSMLDVFWFMRDTAARIERHVRFDDGYSVLFQHRPQVCVTAHMGSWEVMGQATGLLGFDLVSVAARLNNPAVDRMIIEVRERHGQRVVPQEGAVKSLLRTLRSGGKVALLLDQNTKPSEGGVFMEFFGLPATMSLAGAVLALRTGSDILFAFCRPRPDGTYRVSSPRITIPVAPGSDHSPEAVLSLTREIARIIEEAIREDPGAWMWMYKRWKYVAPGHDRSEFPFYAKYLGT
jgi:Kdo2-lipid IVA lauroyltransferase/acyltransferase